MADPDDLEESVLDEDMPDTIPDPPPLSSLEESGGESGEREPELG